MVAVGNLRKAKLKKQNAKMKKQSAVS